MIGATAKSDQFRDRSGSEATKGSRKGFSLLGGGEDVVAQLTDEERRDSLKRRLHYLMDLRKTGNQMSCVGKEIQEVTNQISAIRKSIKSKNASAIPSLFMDICREQMTRLQFQRVLDEANRRQRGESVVAPVMRAGDR